MATSSTSAARWCSSLTARTWSGQPRSGVRCLATGMTARPSGSIWGCSLCRVPVCSCYFSAWRIRNRPRTGCTLTCALASSSPRWSGSGRRAASWSPGSRWLSSASGGRSWLTQTATSCASWNRRPGTGGHERPPSMSRCDAVPPGQTPTSWRGTALARHHRAARGQRGTARPLLGVGLVLSLGRERARVVRKAGPRTSRLRVVSRGGSTARRGYDGSREVAGVMGLGRVCQARRLTVGHQPLVAVLPVGQVCAGLLPVDEGRLVAPVGYAVHGAQMRFAAYERVHQVAFLPGCAGPVGVVRLGQHVGAEVALRVLCLFHYGDGVSEELIEERRVPEPKPGNHDDRHRCLPGPARRARTSRCR